MDPTSNEISKCLAILNDICQDHIGKLFQKWDKAGHKNFSKKMDIIYERVQQRFDDMIHEEEAREYNLALKIEKQLKEAAKLCLEIGISYDTVTAKLEDRSISLLQVDKILNDRLQMCRECKEERIRRYNELLIKEQNICNMLLIPKRQKLLRVPREADLDEFANYIAKKLVEVEESEQKFKEMREEVISTTFELKCIPETSFHKRVLSDQHIIFSGENMALLTKLHLYVKERLENSKLESLQLRSKLCTLWEHLNVDYEVREKLLEQYSGYSLDKIGSLKAEIKKCETKRRHHIHISVAQIRKTLTDWWDKSCYGNKQRRKFKPFYIECYNEDLLELHELEIEKVKKYYIENNEILLLTKRLELLWERMTELHEKSSDPKRLFTNRGGQLLKEEKERKTIQKDLPVVEKQIKNLLDLFEENNRAPFEYYDQNLRDVMKSYRNDFQRVKTECKGSRNHSKGHACLDPGSPSSKRNMTRANTPVTVPRKITRVKSKAVTRIAKTSSSTPPRSRVRRLCCRSET